MRGRCCCLPLLILLWAAVHLAPSAAGQAYELVDPSGAVLASIEVARGRLVVHQRTGERAYYSRDVRFDSADRGFVGYLNLDTNRVLRFPRSGSGRVQTADLDDLAPRYRNSRHLVRPAGRPVAARPLHGGGWPGVRVPPVPGYIPPLSPIFGDPYATGYRGLGPPAQSVLIDSQTIPHPPLPPARVLLRNDGPRELQVAVVDLANPSGTQSMRIEPGAAAEVTLERDAGAQRLSHYRVITPFGESMTQEFVSEIAPAIRYEVVVHEWAMQSVAIDRTGKSPSPIEDVNYQGRGIGRFPLPPGPQLQSGTIEVYREARRRQNQGSIPPIVPAEDLPGGDTIAPLERAILEAQRAAQGR